MVPVALPIVEPPAPMARQTRSLENISSRRARCKGFRASWYCRRRPRGRTERRSGGPVVAPAGAVKITALAADPAGPAGIGADCSRYTIVFVE